MHRQYALYIIYVLLIVVGAVGCERTLPMPVEPTPLPQAALSPLSPTPTLIAPEGQRLILWHTLSGPEELAVQHIVDGFNQENEWGIQITVEAVATLSDLEANLTAAIQAGQLPDLLIVPDSTLPELLAMQAVAQDVANWVGNEEWHLDQRVERDLFLNAFPSGDVVDHQGYVAVPMSFDVVALMYTPSSLRQARLTAPPSTWDEFEVACQAFQERTQPCLTFQPRADVILNLAWALGSTYPPSSEASPSPEEDEGLLLTATLLRALADNGAILPQNVPTEVMQAVLDAEAAFGIESTAVMEGVDDEHWAVAPLPSLSDKPVMLASSPLLVMLATHDINRKVASWLFIRTYLSSPESQAIVALAANAFPISRRAAEEVAVSSRWSPPMKALLPWLSAARARPLSPQWAAISPVVEEVAVQLLNRELTPQEAINMLTESNTP
ncbi:MAG: extracellular solute-binding protein [Ardenticatenia bacterium]|nr:extracellular solute-binding protein [Ardenticatenia bacterium]